MKDGAGLRLRALEKRFGRKEVLQGINLEAEPGEILALTGPSGAGKSTTCRIVSGIEDPNGGELWLGGREIGALSPQARDIAYMYESYALYPNFNVYDNVAWPLRAPGRRTSYDETRIRDCVQEVLDLVELSEFGQRLPGELSGGQKQRVALCRAIIREPAAFLLDEPISHLDAKLRHKLRAAVRVRLKSMNAPTVWCTPDATEGLSVADRVAVLVNGRLLQVGTPEDVYRSPSNVGVARLMGDPSMNLLSGEVVEDACVLVFVNQSVAVRLPAPIQFEIGRSESSEEFVLGIRPADLEICSPEDDASSSTGEVYAVEPFGKFAIVTVRLGEQFVKVKSYGELRAEAGSVIGVRFPDEEYILFEGKSGDAVRMRE